MGLIGSLDSGVSAMKAFTRGIEVIGNNIANVNTYGYKRQRTDYADNFSQVFSKASGNGGSAPTTNQVGTGSRVASTTTNFNQGDTTSTGIITDLAIYGEGFFVLVDPNNSAKYVTRAGNFGTDKNDYLLAPNGMRLQGLTGGAINYTVTEVAGQLVFTVASKTAPSAAGDMRADFGLTVGGGLTVDSSVTSFNTAQIEAAAPQLDSFGFDTNGNLTMVLSDGASFTKGKVLLTKFENPNALSKAGDNLFNNFDAAGPTGGTMTLSAANNTPGTNGLATFKTEALELSNVDLTNEFANLITTQRSFQAASRIITVSDDILQEVVNLKR